MSQHPAAAQTRPHLPLGLPFPTPGPMIANAYRELDLAQHGDDKNRASLGNLDLLPRPWIPGSITNPRMRQELWEWLEAVTDWVNTEHVWDSTGMIPACWPMHPHLVHEIAVLADLRHKAGRAFTGDPLEEWHRYALPAFFDRIRTRTKTGCEERHREWPARAAYARFTAQANNRADAYRLDHDHTRQADDPTGPIPRLQLIDGHNIRPDTGEVIN